MDKLKFKVSAELKNILGKDLITSPFIAILELVKNSYDAHATRVILTFDEGKLIIADNGKGMSLDDLINKWLFIAYSAKRDGTEDVSYRSKMKRHYAGAKGIGRMSCDRLSRHLKLVTRSVDSPTTEVLDIDWSLFDNQTQTEFDAVEIPHESINTIPDFPFESHSGTILEFSGLYDTWGAPEIRSLKKSLEKMINPFSGSDDFQIEIIVPSEVENDRILAQSVAEKRLNLDLFSDSKKGSVTDEERKIVNGVIKNSIADVLKLKTTQIESRLENGMIYTTLSDRGVEMYRLKEVSPYDKLHDVSIGLFYLNRAAKYSFSMSMGVTPVKYGNVFLFRNGFRIWPYGELGDDSWGLNSRAVQGYNRFLGSRDLFGRVDVETDDPDTIKEVSSRDGGLIMTDAARQLMEYFQKTHRRLERYVVGVLWGESFIRNDYFVNQQEAQRIRKKLQEAEKDSASSEHVFDNIGSKVDFLQLIKSLVNDNSLEVLYYNEKLANIVSDTSATELIHAGMIDDLRKVATKSGNSQLSEKIDAFERELVQLRLQKEEAERKRREAELKRQKAEEKAAEEKTKRIKAEKELEQKSKQNLFLLSVGSLDVDRILKYHHDIRIHAATIHNTVGQFLKKVNRNSLTTEEMAKLIERISRANDKITSIAQFATKANFNIDADVIKADIVQYIDQYVSQVLPDFYSEISLHCSSNGCSRTIEFAPLEACIFIDNLLSNTSKVHAKNFNLKFEYKKDKIQMTITDDGPGLSPDILTPNDILEKGYTTTNGSGLGLHNVSTFVRDVLRGTIQVERDKEQSGFRLIITF